MSEQATTKEIKSAYRKKAMKLHPDVNKAPNAKEQFMECKTAYETLIDEKSRNQYDRARNGGSGFGIGGDFGADWDSFGKYARCGTVSLHLGQTSVTKQTSPQFVYTALHTCVSYIDTCEEQKAQPSACGAHEPRAMQTAPTLNLQTAKYSSLHTCVSRCDALCAS